jgi:toxin-antitoxin system PIN domain toxin
VRSLLDVALLIALLQEHHAHYDRAHEWWAANRTDGWASCPLTQNGFLRIVPQLRFPESAPDPFDLLTDMIAVTDHEFWADDLSLLDEEIIDRSRVLGPKQLTDIYLLALAVKRAGRLVTFDRAIPLRAVRHADAHHLVVI